MTVARKVRSVSFVRSHLVQCIQDFSFIYNVQHLHNYYYWCGDTATTIQIGLLLAIVLHVRLYQCIGSQRSQQAELACHDS